MASKHKRQQKLVNIIKKQGLLSVKTLATALDVSEMTIRRDLKQLRIIGLEEHEFFGQLPSESGEYDLFAALMKANEQKDRIGRFAASLIDHNDVIIIDTGSTTARMLSNIPEDHNLTVMCYNANVLFELRYKKGIQLLFCGGVYHRNTEMFESPESIQFIERTRANKVFLSAAGIHAELGITCANAYEVATKNAIIKSASQRILLADSSKFGQLRSSYFCDLSDVDVVVSDKSLSVEWQEILRAQSIELYLV